MARNGAVTTGAVAAILGVHPNTLRWYESAGYLPSVPRTPNGYRQFSPELVRLARVVRESQPLLRVYGPIRRATFLFLAACKKDCVLYESSSDPRFEPYHRSLEYLDALTELLREEHRLSLDAPAALDRFRRGENEGLQGVGLHGNVRTEARSHRGSLRYIGDAAVQTGLSRDQIINLEHDGLGRYPRSNAGYRLFGA